MTPPTAFATRQSRRAFCRHVVGTVSTACAALLAASLVALAPVSQAQTPPAQASGAAGDSASAQTPPQACPALAAYYPDLYFSNADSPVSASQWGQLADTLATLQPVCLRSSEFYALLGAAQMNAGRPDSAAESLERALLLDPDNGAAQVDYASVLFAAGQLFPALQLNEALLARADLPASLRSTLLEREARWRANTRQHGLQLDITGGYDNNLNGAPDAGDITLTLSGEPVLLSLNEDFRSRGGADSNLRLASRLRTATPGGQRSWSNELRGRVSDDKDSDLLQLDSRYSVVNTTRRRSVQWEGAATTLHFGGNALYSAAQTRLRYQANNQRRCAPVVDLATQYQLFHSQDALDALESRATAGLSCVARSGRSAAVSRYGFEFGYLNNLALDSRRPGQDRDGWQATARFQRSLLRGELFAQASYTRLTDSDTYSPVLANGARRWQERSQLLIQHRTPISLGARPALLLINFSHQDQASNIGLFELNDTAFEVGISVPL